MNSEWGVLSPQGRNEECVQVDTPQAHLSNGLICGSTCTRHLVDFSSIRPIFALTGIQSSMFHCILLRFSVLPSGVLQRPFSQCRIYLIPFWNPTVYFGISAVLLRHLEMGERKFFEIPLASLSVKWGDQNTSAFISFFGDFYEIMQSGSQHRTSRVVNTQQMANILLFIIIFYLLFSYPFIMCLANFFKQYQFLQSLYHLKGSFWKMAVVQCTCL